MSSKPENSHWYNTLTQVVLFIFTNCPQLPMVQLMIFWLYNVAKAMYKFSRKHTLIFEFGSFPRLAICGTIFSCDAGQWRWATAASQPHNHRGKQLIHWQPFRIHTTILVFTVSKIFNKLCEILSTLLQNGICVRRFCPTVG